MTINTSKLGWPIAAVLAGALATGALSGFQASPAPKFATVDMMKVFNESPLATTNSETLDAVRKARFSVIEFLNRNAAMDANDAKKFADLSVKANPTPADKTEIDRLRAVGEAATANRATLMTKNPPTDADKTALADYGSKVAANRNLLQLLDNQYTDEVQKMMGDLRTKTLARVREVVRTVSAKGGYTLVIDSEVAPYAANDLTDEVAKALKK